MIRLSERRLKKLNQDIQIAVDECLKPVRGLESADIFYTIHVKRGSRLFDKVEGTLHESDKLDSTWKELKLGKNATLCIWM